MNFFPIADLHCDLLCYLAFEKTRSPYDLAVRCSIPQLLAGPVNFQLLPIFTPTEEGSVASGLAQLKVYHTQLKQHAVFGSTIRVQWAIENASALVSEEESLQEGLQRLGIAFSSERPVYVSLTWNGENRFGGGAATPNVGLKGDGKELLRFLSGQGIAVDFSHASDPLAYDILEQIDKEKLSIPVIASHSNFRAVCDVPRNLPDPLAKEIFRRGGVIGLNFVRMFVGPENPTFFARQLAHGLQLGGENQLCLGADFFYGLDVPASSRQVPEVYWFSDYDNASCYGKVIQIWKKELGLSDETIKRITSLNFNNYLSNLNPI